MAKRIFKIIAWFLGILFALLLILLLYVRVVSMTEPPHVADVSMLEQDVVQPDSGLFTLGNNWFRKSNSGLYEKSTPVYTIYTSKVKLMSGA